MSPMQHRFPFTPPRRWSGGRIALLVAVAVVAFGGVASWRRPAQGSSAQATPARAAVGADASVGTTSQAMTVYKGPAVVGIAVPGMPTGSPGMDGPKVPYKVVSFDRTGTLTTFAER